jgi:hypothetical protein
MAGNHMPGRKIAWHDHDDNQSLKHGESVQEDWPLAIDDHQIST